MRDDDVRVRLVGGAGTVLRSGQVVALLGVEETPATVAAVTEAARTTDTPEALDALLARVDGHGGVTVGVLLVTGDATRVRVRGSVAVSIGDRQLAGDAASEAWRGRDLGPDVTVRMTLPGSSGIPVAHSRLGGGVVPASGVQVSPAGLIVEDGSQTGSHAIVSPAALTPAPGDVTVGARSGAPLVPDAAHGGSTSVSLRGVLVAEDDLPARDPLPIATHGDHDVGDESPLVDGVRCVREHFNRPDVLYCSRCGISMVHATLSLVKGPRPPLGVLVAEDGATYSLDTGYLIGRQPDPGALDDGLRPLVMDDPEHSVSRTHAQVRLDAWDVVVEDRGSSNGTWVAPQGEPPWTRIEAGAGHTLNSGDWVLCGRRVLVFEGHHVRGDQPKVRG